MAGRSRRKWIERESSLSRGGADETFGGYVAGNFGLRGDLARHLSVWGNSRRIQAPIYSV